MKTPFNKCGWHITTQFTIKRKKIQLQVNNKMSRLLQIPNFIGNLVLHFNTFLKHAFTIGAMAILSLIGMQDYSLSTNFWSFITIFNKFDEILLIKFIKNNNEVNPFLGDTVDVTIVFWIIWKLLKFKLNRSFESTKKSFF